MVRADCHTHYEWDPCAAVKWLSQLMHHLPDDLDLAAHHTKFDEVKNTV
jgi:hypothetical protein